MDLRIIQKERNHVRIAIIDNNKEETRKGSLEVIRRHHEPEFFPIGGSLIWMMEKIRGVDCVVTDLMMNPFHDSDTRYEGENEPPSGLLVVIHAVAVLGVPVVICTDFSNTSKNHHDRAASWIYDGYFARFREIGSPNQMIGWVEDKDWGRAIDMTIAMVENKKKNL